LRKDPSEGVFHHSFAAPGLELIGGGAIAINVNHLKVDDVPYGLILSA